MVEVFFQNDGSKGGNTGLFPELSIGGLQDEEIYILNIICLFSLLDRFVNAKLMGC